MFLDIGNRHIYKITKVEPSIPNLYKITLCNTYDGSTLVFLYDISTDVDKFPFLDFKNTKSDTVYKFDNVTKTYRRFKMGKETDFTISEIFDHFPSESTLSDFVLFKEPTNTKDIPCSHEWTSYTGFSESYNYCKLCDLKK